MSKETNRKYLLVIRKGRSNYLSFEWHLTKYYQGENMYTLAGIDNFTRNVTRSDLLKELIDQHQIEPTELIEKYTIIYQENGKIHELKEGAIFKEDFHVISEDDLIHFLFAYQSDKNLYNEIYTIINPNDQDEKLREFCFVIKTISLFKLKGPTAVKVALSIFKEVSYEKKRTLLLKISKNIIPKYISKENNVSLVKKEETKVA